MPGTEQSVPRHASLYRRLLWLYPASFRNEYRPAMVQLFCDQLRDEVDRRPRRAASRVWVHALRDLVISVPNQRIEVFMSEQQTAAQLITVVVTIAASVGAIVLFGVYGAALLAAVAGWIVYQRGRARYVQLPGQNGWQRWMLAGAGLLVVSSIPVVLSIELGQAVWALWALLTLAGLVAIAIGAATGMRGNTRSDPHTPSV
jgi:hypothetical protein